MEINLVLTPKTSASPSHHPEPAGFSMTWEDPASLTHLQVSNASYLIFGLAPGFWALFIFGVVCVLCKCVYFVCFLRLYPPLLASYFMRDTWRVYTLAKYQNLPGTNEMSDGMLAPVWNISRAKDSSTLSLAHCYVPNIFLSKKYLTSRQWLYKVSHLTMGNKFPRQPWKQISHILSLHKW